MHISAREIHRENIFVLHIHGLFSHSHASFFPSIFHFILVHGVSQQQAIQQQPQQVYQQQQQQQQFERSTQQYQQVAPKPYGGGPAGGRREPIFEQVFQNARFAQGGDALFQGRLGGNPKPRVSWTRKGAPLLESQKYRMTYNEATGDVSLLIRQISPEDIGEYTCFAVNDYGEAICSVFIQFEGQPQIQGYRKEFAQTFESTQNTLGQHTQSTQRYEQQQNFSNGYNNYSLVEEDFKVDTFEYRLLREVSFRESITRRHISESDCQLSTQLDRNMGPAAPPQIAQKPRNSKLIEGSDAVFTAKVGANPKPRLTWFRNGKRIVASEKYEMTYSNQQATLRIRNATYADSGHYTLLAENTQGIVVSSAVLAIEPAAESATAAEPRPVDTMAEVAEAGKALAPTFVRTFQDRETSEGKMSRFDCRVTGRPYPEVLWYINGEQVRDDATHKILVNESGNHSLMIINVSRRDAGVVSCVARNKSGEVACQARLAVLEKEVVVAPKFVERFTTVSVHEGEPVQLNARAVGTPTPRITWQKDGAPIVASPDTRVAIEGGATTLDILRAKASDSGWYQCTAQNVAGSTATRARLYVEVPKEGIPEQRRLHLPRPTKVIEPE